MSSVQRGVLVGFDNKATGPDDTTWCATWQDADEMLADYIAERARDDSPVTTLELVERDVSDARVITVGATAQAVDAPVEKQWRDMNIEERNAHVDKANERAAARNTHNPFDYICTKRIDGEPYHEHGLCPICRQPAVPADPPKPAIAQAMSSIAAGLREKGLLSDTTEPITLTRREPKIEAWEVDEENMTFIAALLDGSVSYRLLGDETVKPNYVTAYVNGVEHPLHVGYWVVKTTDPVRRHPKWEVLSVEQKERLYA